jgi:DNA-binding NtrC family response regulator
VKPSDKVSLTFHEATRRFQEQFLRDALEQASWNIAQVARMLDLTRGHIYNLMATLRIQRPASNRD